MNVALNGRAFHVALDMRGRCLVLIRCSPRMWRVANVTDSNKVLRGLRVAALKGGKV